MLVTNFEYNLESPIEISGKTIKTITVKAPNRDVYDIHIKMRAMLMAAIMDLSKEAGEKKKEKEDKPIELDENGNVIQPNEEDMPPEIYTMQIYASKSIEHLKLHKLFDEYLQKMATTDAGIRIDNIILPLISLDDIEAMLGAYMKYFFIAKLNAITQTQKRIA